MEVILEKDKTAQNIMGRRKTIPDLVSRLPLFSTQLFLMTEVVRYCYDSLLYANLARERGKKKFYKRTVTMVTAGNIWKCKNDLPGKAMEKEEDEHNIWIILVWFCCVLLICHAKLLSVSSTQGIEKFGSPKKIIWGSCKVRLYHFPSVLVVSESLVFMSYEMALAWKLLSQY